MTQEPDLPTLVADVLDVDREIAARIVDAFKSFVADPLSQKLSNLSAKDVRKRNPFAYAALGILTTADLEKQAKSDIMISSVEGLVGNWLEEVAVIVSGGVKPGGGVDLQVDRTMRADHTVEIYAIQSTTNTKNAGGRKSDLRALETTAQVLRAQRRHVEKYVGYLFGRMKTTSNNGVTNLSSKDFWLRVSGKPGFLARLFLATRLMAESMSSRLREESEELTALVLAELGDELGQIDPTKLRL